MDGLSIQKNEQRQDQLQNNRVENAQGQQNLLQQPLQEEANRAPQADPLQERIPAQPVGDAALRRVAPAANNDFELIASKETVLAQMDADMSLGTSLLMGKVTKSRLKEARKQFRAKFDARDRKNRNDLVEEMKVYIAQNEVFKARDRELKERIKTIKAQARTQQLDQQGTEELANLELEEQEVAKIKKRYAGVIKEKREMAILVNQELRIRHLVAHYRERLEREKSDGNSALMNDIIQKVENFDNLINTAKFDIAKQYTYMHQFVEMRNAVAVYYNKNNVYKFSNKGERRRDLMENFLKHLNNWVVDLPDEVQDTFLEEMEKPEYESVRALKSSDEMYQAMGEKAFKKKIPANEGRRIKLKDYVNPMSIRMISALRIKQREISYARSYDLPAEEVADFLRSENNKHPEITSQDDRCFGYTFGGLKRNFDGTPVDEQREKQVREGVAYWRHNDLEKMKPVYDEIIERVLNYELKLEDFLPQNIKKKGPTLLRQQELILSIQNVFAQGTMGDAYLNSQKPAVRSKIEMIKALSPFVTVFENLCIDMNISTVPGAVGKVRAFETWRKLAKGKNNEAIIKRLVAHPESMLNMDVGFPTENYVGELDHVPDAATPTAFRKKYHLDRAQVNENKEFIIPEENKFLSSMVAILEDEVQRGEYFAEENSLFRVIDVAKELRALAKENKDFEDEIADVYYQIDKKETEFRKCMVPATKAQLQEELEKLHEQKNDYVRYVKDMHDKKKALMPDFPEAKNHFLARYYGNQNRDAQLAGKFAEKRTKPILEVSADAFFSNTDYQLDLIKKVEFEKKLEQNGLPEEKKAAYRNFIEAQNALLKARDEYINAKGQIAIESNTANNTLLKVHQRENAANVPRDKRTDITNSLIGKEYKERFHSLLVKSVEKHKAVVDLAKQSRDILWKQAYRFVGFKNRDNQWVAPEKAGQILDTLSEYMKEQDYLDALKKERANFRQQTSCFDAASEVLKLPESYAYIDQAMDQQYARIEDVKKRLMPLCIEAFPELERADFAEILGMVKSNIHIETEQGDQTLRQMEKEEYVGNRLFAMVAAGGGDMQMSREGAEFAYRRNHLFASGEEGLLARYVVPGSAKDKELRQRFSSENLDRIVAAGLHYIRFDENGVMNPADAQKDAWNRKWIKACTSDNYEQDIKPMLQDIMDELLKFGESSYTDRINLDIHIDTDEHFQAFMRHKRIALTFESNMLKKNPAFAPFEEEYKNGTEEQKLKWKMLDVQSKVDAAANNYLITMIEKRYFLHESFSKPSTSMPAVDSKLENYLKELNEAIYYVETMKYANNKFFKAKSADAFMRMMRIPNFDIAHVERYEEFFTFYAKVDDIEAQIVDANAQIAEIDKALAQLPQEGQEEKREELTGKKATLTGDVAKLQEEKDKLIAGDAAKKIDGEKAIIARANQIH